MNKDKYSIRAKQLMEIIKKEWEKKRKRDREIENCARNKIQFYKAHIFINFVQNKYTYIVYNASVAR